MASKRVLATLGLAVALILVAPATTLASGTLDQQVTTSNNAHAVAGTLQPAQVFTAGITGVLTMVDLYLTIGPGPGPGTGSLADDLTVQIWTVVAGAPGSLISGASATVLRSALSFGSGVWIHVPISAPSVSGTQYAIVLSAPAANLGDCPDVCWQWLFDGNNPYAGGPSYFRYCCGAWTAQARDFDFKTYVIPSVQVQIYLSGTGEGSNGQVTSNPAGIDCGSTCLAAFSIGSTLSLTAEPLNGGNFGHWEGANAALCSGQGATCTFMVPATNVELAAAFTGITPPISQPPATPVATTPGLTPRPSATSKASTAPTTPGSTATPTGPGESPIDSGLATAQPTAEVTPAPGATPGPTAGPSVPAAAEGGTSMIVLLLLVVAALVAGGAGMYYVLRRRAGVPPPTA